MVLSFLLIGVHAYAQTSRSSFRVTSPNGGETLIQSSNNSITWQGGNSSVYVGIVDANTTNAVNPVGNPYHLIGWLTTTGIANGSFNWSAQQVCDMGHISCWNIAPGQYKIIIATRDSNNLNNINFSVPFNTSWDVSDAPFTIVAPTTCNSSSTPSITVTSPNGGEVYTTGQQINVTWNSCNIPATDDVTIEMVPANTINVPNGMWVTLSGQTPNDGSQVVTLNTAITGTYELTVKRISPPYIGDDLSNGLFTINAALRSREDIVTTRTPIINPAKTFVVGSTGNDVIELQKVLIAQKLLNIKTPTGYFGNATQAALNLYKANELKKLPTSSENCDFDGKHCATTTTNTNHSPINLPTSTLPVGCNSTLGYSSITGLPCSGVATYPAGCTSALGYSMTTGLPCNGTTLSTLPPGCFSTAGYSYTTGLPCSGVATYPTYPAGCTSTAGYSLTTGLSCNGSVATIPLPVGCLSTSGYSSITGLACWL